MRFREKGQWFAVTDHLYRVLAVYPDANVTVEPEGLILLPSSTHIGPRHLRAIGRAAR